MFHTQYLFLILFQTTSVFSLSFSLAHIKPLQLPLFLSTSQLFFYSLTPPVFVLHLPYTNFLLLKLYLSVGYGIFTLRFMSTMSNTKKVTIFLHFFVVLTCLTKSFVVFLGWMIFLLTDLLIFVVFLCWMDVLHPRSTFLCCISLFDGCFAVRFTSTMKNTKKGSNFFAFFRFSTIFG